MIDLTGEPSLSTIVLSRDGALKYTYVLPIGMTFPDNTSGTLVFTDRAGGVYAEAFFGDINSDNTKMTWTVLPVESNEIPPGANFEITIYLSDVPYKVRYGRVARKEAEFPLNPLIGYAPPLMYEDTLQRNKPGPRWIAKHGRVAMHRPAGAPDYALAARNNVEIFGGGLTMYSAAAALWYAPTQGDTIEMTVGLCDGGDGDTTIVLCSNYAMTSFLGVRFRDAGLFNPPDRIEFVTGSAWNDLTVQGSGYGHLVPDDGQFYTIKYSLTTNTVNVAIGGAAPVFQWTDTSGIVIHGAGFRYTGVIFNSTLVDTGPQLYYWKVKDAV